MKCEICNRIFNHKAFDVDGKCACLVCHVNAKKAGAEEKKESK